MTIVATMAAKKIYSDPTMVVVEGRYVPENGDLSPAYAPFVGTLPPATERGFPQGVFRCRKILPVPIIVPVGRKWFSF